MAEKKEFDVGKIESFENNVGKIKVPRKEDDSYYYFHADDLIDQNTKLNIGQFVSFNIEEVEDSDDESNKATGVLPLG